MRFSQILYLSLLCILTFTCRETMGEQQGTTPKNSTVPPSEGDSLQKDLPKIEVPKPGKKAPNEPIQKKSSKEWDTLRPGIAMLYK